MKNALKGALLSALVFPGVGQLAQKRYRPALVLLLGSLAALAVVVVITVRQAQTVLAHLAAAGGTPDLAAISAAAAQVAPGGDQRLIDVAILVLVGCWIVGVFDAILGGRRMDRKEKSKRSDSPSDG
jgi:hypothetical protein